MRFLSIAVALGAAVAATGNLRALGLDDAAAGISPKPNVTAPAAAPLTPPPANAADRPIRLAQARQPKNGLGWQATSGNPTVAPFKWAGLLAIPTLDDPDTQTLCTGQFITPNVVLTAAHCLQDPSTPKGPWPNPSTGTFMLQYQNGHASQTFKIVCGAANPLWAQKLAGWNGVEHDFAMLLVDGTSPTGHMSYALDWKGRYAYAWRIGYPQDILSGSFIEFAPGIVFFGDSIPFAETGKLGGPPLMSNAVVQWGPITDATHGMSGGAWIANMDEDNDAGSNVLIAVTSSGPIVPNTSAPLFPGGTWAAYLTSAEFNPLLDYVSGGCKGTLAGATAPPAAPPAPPPANASPSRSAQ